MGPKINRPIAYVLLVLLYPFVLISRLIGWLRGDKNPEYGSTIEGDPLAYSGSRPLVVAVWGRYASVWTVSTAQVVEDLKSEFEGKCEFAYVESSSRAVDSRFQVEIVPTVVVFSCGKEVARFVNLSEIDEIRPTLQTLLA